MIIKNQGKMPFIFLSIFIIFIDQLTKYLIDVNYQSYLNNNYFFISINYVKNFGAAFNIFTGNRVFLSLISLFFSFFLLYMIFRDKKTKKLELLSYSFILGGSLGNGIDRIIKGYVIDFINLKFIDFPVFNIADISINIGLIIIILGYIRYKKI